NKIDVAGEAEAKKKFSGIKDALYISAAKQEHIDELRKQLLALVLDKKVNNGNTIVSNIRHYDALLKTEQALNDALNGLTGNLTKELLALDIRRALSFLGEI